MHKNVNELKYIINQCDADINNTFSKLLKLSDNKFTENVIYICKSLWADLIIFLYYYSFFSENGSNPAGGLPKYQAESGLPRDEQGQE